MRARLMFTGLVAGLVGMVGVQMGAQTPGASSERKLELTFDGNGYATLIAQNVSVSEVFAKWAQIGGSKILNAERLPRTPIFVEFDRTPEYKLVESLVRLSKAQNPGWIVAPRLVDAPVTPSRLATISILPTSSPTNSYSSTTSSSQAAPLYPQGTVDDTELPPVMPPLGSGPAQAPQPAPAARSGPGIPVIPVGGPGRGGGGGGTRVPQG